MENKEKYAQVGKEILEVFKNYKIEPRDMIELLDNLSLAVALSMIDIASKQDK